MQHADHTRLQQLEKQLASINQALAAQGAAKPVKPRITAWQLVTKRRILLYCAVILLVVVTIFVIAFSIRQTTVRNPFSHGDISAAGYPIYYPTQLPDGFTIDYGSVAKPQADVVAITITGPDAKKIYLTETPAPTKDFNLSSFYGSFQNADKLTTQLGVATTGRLNGKSNVLSLIIGNKTWIIINSVNASANDIALIAQHLSKAE